MTSASIFGRTGWSVPKSMVACSQNGSWCACKSGRVAIRENNMVHDPVAVREKQLQVWDVSDDPRWRLTVYEPLWGGKIYANNGGPALLDYMGAYVGLGPEHSLLELGSGMGDACEYVASHFGCRVTGLEMSARQIERARARHRDRRSRGFDFVEADMLQWEPSE